MLAIFYKLCCCCLCRDRESYRRRLLKYERHVDARDKLTDEIDLMKLLYVQRLGEYIAKLVLKKHQRTLASTSFKKFQIDELD